MSAPKYPPAQSNKQSNDLALLGSIALSEQPAREGRPRCRRLILPDVLLKMCAIPGTGAGLPVLCVLTVVDVGNQRNVIGTLSKDRHRRSLHTKTLVEFQPDEVLRLPVLED